MRKSLIPMIMVVCLAAAPLMGQEPVTAFVNVSVVPMDSERVLTEQTVLVRGNRIAAMGPTKQVPVPPEAVRVDGKGKFLIPGLADMHSHVGGRGAERVTEAENVLYMYVANGVTTIRVMIGEPEYLVFRERAAKRELLSPRIYVAKDVPLPSKPEKIADAVAAIKAAGYDLIGEYPEAYIDSIAPAARRVGIPIAGHVVARTIGLDQGIQAGYSSIEHLTGWAEYLTGKDGNDRNFGQAPLDESKVRAMAGAMRRAGVWTCPTLLINGYYWFMQTEEGFAQAIEWPELRYLTDSTRLAAKLMIEEARVTPPSIEAFPGMKVPMLPSTGKRPLQSQATRKIIEALRDSSAGLLLGTDAVVDYPVMVPGFSVHRELQALVQAGLTPYEALATGTRNVAVYFGILDSTGTVAVGKQADLVLLDGNPLKDIRNTMRPAGVMLGGRWLARAQLEARMATFEGGKWRVP